MPNINKLHYNGKTLVKVGEITGGKNANGKYKVEGSDPEEFFFIKTPGDKRELFIEAFIGYLLTALKDNGLIPKEYHETLICADLIKIGKGNYALIQPFVKFKEAFKYTETGTDDRNPLYEYWRLNAERIGRLVKGKNYYGLSFALFMSLLIGDYSVHTGNVVGIEKEDIFLRILIILYCKIDFGAALRNFADPENNVDILKGKETRGALGFFSQHKDYIKVYGWISGLYQKMYKKSEEFKKAHEKTPDLFIDALKYALNKIPDDFLTEKDQGAIADYIGIKSFANIKFNDKSDKSYVDFINKFIDVINTRLNLFKQLDTSNKSIENSLVDESKNRIAYDSFLPRQEFKCEITGDSSFINLLEVWNKKKVKRTLIFNGINVDKLKEKYNDFINETTDKINNAMIFNGKENVLAAIHRTNGNGLSAFIPQLKESFILRKIYAINNKHHDHQVFIEDYSEASRIYAETNQDSSWAKVATLLISSSNLVNLIEMLHAEMKKTKVDNDFSENLYKLIEDNLNRFQNAYTNLQKLPKIENLNEASPEPQSQHFYPFSEEELNNLNAAQLTMIAIEECDSNLSLKKQTPLLKKLIKTVDYYNKIDNFIKNNDDKLNSNEKKVEHLKKIRSEYSADKLFVTPKSIINLNEINETIPQECKPNPDIIALTKFKDAAIERLTDEYHIKQVEKFYSAAVDVLRNSNLTVTEKKQDIQNLANDNFTHRNWFMRFVTDFFAFIGYPLGGFAVDKHNKLRFFIATRREKDLNDLFNKENTETVFSSCANK